MFPQLTNQNNYTHAVSKLQMDYRSMQSAGYNQNLYISNRVFVLAFFNQLREHYRSMQSASYNHKTLILSIITFLKFFTTKKKRTIALTDGTGLVNGYLRGSCNLLSSELCFFGAEGCFPGHISINFIIYTFFYENKMTFPASATALRQLYMHIDNE